MPSIPAPLRVAARVLGWALGGLVVGVLGTFKHRVGVSGGGPPVGLVLSLAMVALVLLALRVLLPTRLPALAAAIGVVVAAGVLALPGPGGGAVVLLDPTGLAWLLGALVVGAVAVVWPRRRPRVGRPDADGILAHDPMDDGTGAAPK